MTQIPGRQRLESFSHLITESIVSFEYRSGGRWVKVTLNGSSNGGGDGDGCGEVAATAATAAVPAAEISRLLTWRAVARLQLRGGDPSSRSALR